MSEEQQPESNLPAPLKHSRPPRRRGHRGGRGRRRPAPAPVAVPPGENEIPATPTSVEPTEGKSSVPREEEMNGSAVSRAVTEVMQIVETLKQSLLQMEEVLELVELAERQKLGDEREIESLRRALRQLHSRGRHERHEPDERSRPED